MSSVSIVISFSVSHDYTFVHGFLQFLQVPDKLVTCTGYCRLTTHASAIANEIKLNVFCIGRYEGCHNLSQETFICSLK